MNIPICRSENVCVSQEGRAIAMYFADKWAKEGKAVSWEETTKCISVSCTQLFSLGEFKPKEDSE